MAKIQRLQRQESFNKPIGVVTPSTAGVQAGEDLSRLGSQMFQTYYAKAVDEEKIKGQEFADQFRVRDDDQKISYRSLPKSLSKVARAEAQPLVDKKYRTEILSDMKNTAERLRADFPNDPDGFDGAFSEYVNKTASLVDERHKSFTMDAGAVLAGENTAALYAKKIDAEDEASFKNAYNLIQSDLTDLAAQVEAGEISRAFAGNGFGSINKRIDDLVDEHGDRLSVTAAFELKKQVKRAYGGALMNNVANNVMKRKEFQDPVNGANKAANVLNSLEIAYRTGRTDNMSAQTLAILKEAGFTESQISPEFLDAESRRIIAGDLSVLENNMQEQLQATQKQREALATANSFSQGDIVSQAETDNYFDFLGYTTVEDIMNDLPAILSGKTPQHKAMMNVILHNNSTLPKVVTNIFQADNLEKLANNGQLPLALDLYQQATKRMNKDGSGINTVQRGISNEVASELDSLIAYRNGVKDMSFVEYFQKKNELELNPNRGALLNAKLGKKNDKQLTISDFISESVGDDATQDEINYYMQYAEDLVLLHGKERAADILKQSTNRVFKQSKFTFGQGRSRFAPEKAFIGTELTTFEMSANMILETADGNYKLGKNAFLIPDARYGSVNPMYMLVDKDKMPITDGTKPLMVSGRAVIEQRAKKRKISREEALNGMREEYQRRLQFEQGTSGALQDPSLQGEVTDFFKNNMGAPK